MPSRQALITFDVPGLHTVCIIDRRIIVTSSFIVTIVERNASGRRTNSDTGTNSRKVHPTRLPNAALSVAASVGDTIRRETGSASYEKN
jgi:hypothetical protein